MPGYARPPEYFASNIAFTPAGQLLATNAQTAIIELENEKISILSVDAKGDLLVGNAADSVIRLPVGTDGYVLTASAAAASGMEWAFGTAGATGGGTDQAFYNNDQIITTNYSIPSGKNSMSAGPISINSGITITIPSGSVWTII